MVLSFPWRTLAKVHAESEYVALLGVVRLSGIRMLPTFVRFGARISHQLRHTPGALGFRTGAEPGNLSFYHLSAWTDSAAIHNFVDTAPHVHAVEQLVGRLGDTTFRYWTVTGAALPMSFRRELHRLAM